MDESMSAYQPRLDKLGGLANISFIKRKPKPLGTEFKTVCDTETGVMKFMEIQEGKDGMRTKQFAAEFGVTAACTLRLASSCAPGIIAPFFYLRAYLKILVFANDDSRLHTIETNLMQMLITNTLMLHDAVLVDLL